MYFNWGVWRGVFLVEIVELLGDLGDIEELGMIIVLLRWRSERLGLVVSQDVVLYGVEQWKQEGSGDQERNIVV